MSLVQEVLYTLSNYPGGYRTIYDIIYGGEKPSESDRRKIDSTLRSTLTRLKSKGLVSNGSGEWVITLEGEEFLALKGSRKAIFFEPQDFAHKDYKDRPKRLIVIFDIPENRRKYRDWLRGELIALGFELVQKSVWFGPVLPKNFVEYLDEIGILQYVKFFKATKEDIV